MTERIVADIWIDFADPWCHLALERLVAAGAGLDDVELLVDVHSFPGPGSTYSDDDAARLASHLNANGLEGSPEVLTRGVSEELRMAAHRILHAAKEGATVRNRAVPKAGPQDAGAHEDAAAELGDAIAAARAGVEAARAIQRELLTNPAAGVDELRAVASARSEASFDAAIRRDVEDAKRLRIAGIPLTVIGARAMILGARSTNELAQIIAEVRDAVTTQETAPDRTHLEF